LDKTLNESYKRIRDDIRKEFGYTSFSAIKLYVSRVLQYTSLSLWMLGYVNLAIVVWLVGLGIGITCNPSNVINVKHAKLIQTLDVMWTGMLLVAVFYNPVKYVVVVLLTSTIAFFIVRKKLQNT
jgi:hypothetical protein